MPADGFDFRPADDLITRPVSAFYQNVRQQLRDDLARGWIVKNNHRINACKSSQDFGALAFRNDRTALPFELANALVAVETQDEHITERTRLLEAADVAGMQKVEAAVCKNDAATIAFLAAKPQNRILESQNFRLQKGLHARAKANERNGSLSRGGIRPPGLRALPVNRAKTIRSASGVLLLVIGFLLTRGAAVAEHIYLMDAGGCRLETAFFAPRGGEPQGAVVLLHGLSANKKIMSYLAQGFADQGLKVIVPDLPGHGHTEAPFSAARADQCSESLLRELIVRGIIVPERTILAGHSMGGAIAIRVASRMAANAAASVPFAGVVAISPAPMQKDRGILPEMLLYQDSPPLPANSLVISGSWETPAMKSSAADLVAGRQPGSAKRVVIPHATHLSLLFDSRALAEAERWAAESLHMQTAPSLPSHRRLWGGLLGFLGLLLLLGPFLEEAGGLGSQKADSQSAVSGRLGVSLLVVLAVSFLAVLLLRQAGDPFKSVRLFEGDYFTGFLVIVGGVVLLAKRQALREVLSGKSRALLGTVAAASFAGLVTVLLMTAWFEMTISEAWWKADRWERFPLLLVLLAPYHLAEELVLGPVAALRGLRRLGLGLALRFLGWSALLVGVLALHSGAILLVLLAPYLFLFHVLSRAGMDVVREGTGSAAAAAIFGAILLAGFCLVIFPIT